MLDGTERRLLLIGNGGAGKSTLARRLGAALGLPVVHLDRHDWQPGWVPVEHEAWHAILERLLAEPAWILDGNFGSSMERRIAASDAVVFLDTPRWLCFARVLRRALLDREGVSAVRRTPALLVDEGLAVFGQEA